VILDDALSTFIAREEEPMRDNPFQGSSGGWRMRVLVVEDQPEAADCIALLLRHAGHDTEVAADGPSALAAAEANAPDVVLLDIGLPGWMDGWEVARRLQDWHAFKRPLVVALTGHGDDEDRRRSEEAGIDLHLTKPVDPGQLQKLLSRFRSVIAK
jgi:two-component system, OmpR family, response regulator